jgi:hypothetical protein
VYNHAVRGVVEALRVRAHRRGPVVAVLIALVALLTPASPATGQDGAAARELAERYAPVVVVRDQDGPCDKDGEAYRPVPVETVLDAPGVRLRDETGAVVKEAPGTADIVDLGPKTSLDFNGDPRRPGCTFEQDFDRLGAGRPDVAYAHVATDPSAPGRLALQYWLFWYFDDYVNTHEGDWEFIQLVWDVPTAEQALATPPAETGYSQHSGGERADWDGGKLERRGDHPVVYAAAGSHANFYTPDLFLGRSADQGFGCDDARPPGTALQTQARLLPSGAVDPQGPDAWLRFQGRWGEFQKPPYDAPPGPLAKEEWTGPIAWQEALRDGSFAVPSGTTLGPTATGAFCAVVAIGGRVYTAVSSPLTLVLLVVGLLMSATVAVRGTTWSPREPRPLRRPRAAGQIIGAARAAYRERPGLLVPLGLLFLPAAILEVAVQQVVLELTPLGHLTDVAGRSSLVSIAIALLLAGAGHVFAATIVVGGVALALDAAERGREPGVREAFRLTALAAPRLLRTALRGGGIALLLGVTVVGIPIAAVLLGRWAVAIQVSALEGAGPGDALARSSALVRGRWWRTAAVAATVNVLAAASGPAVGIALMFLTSMPLAAINAVSSAVFVLAMPLAGAALAFLYGDLASRRPAVSRRPAAP